MMSIRVKCTTCSRDDEKRAVYKWNLVEYDPATKATRAINEWENWLETGQLFLLIFHKNVACLALDVNNCCWVFFSVKEFNTRVYFSFFGFVYLSYIVYLRIYTIVWIYVNLDMLMLYNYLLRPKLDIVVPCATRLILVWGRVCRIKSSIVGNPQLITRRSFLHHRVKESEHRVINRKRVSGD